MFSLPFSAHMIAFPMLLIALYLVETKSHIKFYGRRDFGCLKLAMVLMLKIGGVGWGELAIWVHPKIWSLLSNKGFHHSNKVQLIQLPNHENGHLGIFNSLLPTKFAKGKLCEISWDHMCDGWIKIRLASLDILSRFFLVSLISLCSCGKP